MFAAIWIRMPVLPTMLPVLHGQHSLHMYGCVVIASPAKSLELQPTPVHTKMVRGEDTETFLHRPRSQQEPDGQSRIRKTWSRYANRKSWTRLLAPISRVQKSGFMANKPQLS
ncbi:hypothetical protein B0I35DRAFT_127343 [Stachybotrys elegans]|uniref:Secreted protein n=1 Tax=Stachybotrys elegans TaxID=80388 RepID=A0A8K0T317_9HYPO|nr:hypothetical protein B0I35DRAFT_127343 [Stachybotrys elegans]